MLERRAELGGRARTSPPPYQANLGPHALYIDGAFWRWREQQSLLPPTVGRGTERIVFRHRTELRDQLPGAEALAAVIHAAAPADSRSAAGHDSSPAPRSRSCSVPDAGRLSAAFVNERIRRVLQPDVVRYVVGGWQTLVARLAEASRAVGVTIEERHHVAHLPDKPVVVATTQAAAGRLLPGAKFDREGTRVALFDLALDDGTHIPSGLLDLDERLYLARYTSFDPTLAPPGEELIQIACGCRPHERFNDVHKRIDAVLCALEPAWRRKLRWSRRTLLRDATGAVDPPGRTWRDRTPIRQSSGIFCAGDYVAAPGLLSEVSFSSGLEAGAAAASLASPETKPRH